MPLTGPTDFASFDGHVWLNCAHQGPLLTCAAQAAEAAIGWKQRPHELTSERFRNVPARLRQAVARLIGADADDVVLGNSASYGLHLIANGMRWQSEDEVLVMDTDFPSDILPWLRLESRGVTVRRERPRGHVFEPEELNALIGPKTRVLCLTWVHSFSGWSIDLHAIGELCRARDVVFVVNASQGIGARPLNVSTLPADAVISVGFKWLCGPYGTGFCWLHPALRRQLDPPKAYWLSMLTADDLAGSPEIRLKSGLGIRAFDIFGTANFFNFVPWTASIDYLLERGIHAIADYDQMLVTRFLERIDRKRYTVTSPTDRQRRSTLIFITHVVPSRTRDGYDALQRAKIHVAIRMGSIRVSPHLHNSADDIDAAVDVLNAL